MVKLTIETKSLRKSLTGRFVFAVVGDPEGEVDAAIGFIGQTSPYELAETVGNAIGTQFKVITDDTSSRLWLSEILMKTVIMALIGDDEGVKEVETNIKEVCNDKRRES